MWLKECQFSILSPGIFYLPMEVVYFDDRVREFIESLEESVISKVYRTLMLLEQNGYRLRMPHMRILERNLYELRLVGQIAVRLFYAIKNDRAYILHGFVKKTMRIPERELLLLEQSATVLT